MRETGLRVMPHSPARVSFWRFHGPRGCPGGTGIGNDCDSLEDSDLH